MCRFTRSTTSRSRMKRWGWQAPPPGPIIEAEASPEDTIAEGAAVSAVV
jgi:hypothetical protein